MSVHPLAVHHDMTTHETDSVTVIYIILEIHDRERLNRRAVDFVPAIDRHAMGFFGQTIAEDHILFNSGD